MSEEEDFLSYFPCIIKTLEDTEAIFSEPALKDHITKLLDYNLKNGKNNRALFFINTYKTLHKSKKISDEDRKLINIMGWCIEMMQAYFLLLDDIMDKSETRRGQMCWYRHEDIGLSAINDGLIIESIMFNLIRHHFGDKNYYADIMKTFTNITLKTNFGQFFDTNFTMIPKNKISNNTHKMNDLIMCYKTGYYSYVMPVSLALYMNGINDAKIHARVSDVLLEIGKYFQAQDDYLDCFGDPKVIGKIGTDIQEGKCTWLSTKALTIVNAEQRVIMEEFYGIDNPFHINKIRELYKDLDIPKLYHIFEDSAYAKIMNMIKNIKEVPEEIFIKELNKLYHRVK